MLIITDHEISILCNAVVRLRKTSEPQQGDLQGRVLGPPQFVVIQSAQPTDLLRTVDFYFPRIITPSTCQTKTER